MRKEDINILKLKKKNNWSLKNEIKLKLLKGITCNQNIKKIYRNFAFYKLSQKSINRKFKHICLKNNKTSSINNNFYVSKYQVKFMLSSNKAQNITLNSW